MTIAEVVAGDLLGLRGRVLRGGQPHEGFAEDDDPRTLHLAVVVEGRVVAGASFLPRPQDAWQLRGMAVEEARQGQGLGRLLLDAGVERVGARGGRLLWANGRDTALGFYQRMGWRVVGEGFVLSNGVPHHRVELALGPGRPIPTT